MDGRAGCPLASGRERAGLPGPGFRRSHRGNQKRAFPAEPIAPPARGSRTRPAAAAEARLRGADAPPARRCLPAPRRNAARAAPPPARELRSQIPTASAPSGSVAFRERPAPALGPDSPLRRPGGLCRTKRASRPDRTPPGLVRRGARFPRDSRARPRPPRPRGPMGTRRKGQKETAGAPPRRKNPKAFRPRRSSTREAAGGSCGSG